MSESKILEFKNINKSFSGVQALKDVSFSVNKGEVHALLGENGAGKSTLMKILSGAYTKDSGEVIFGGEVCNFKETNDSEEKGISIIYQELNLIPEMSIAENIYLHRQPMKGRFIDWNKMYQDAVKVLEKVGLNCDPRQSIKRLSVAQQQMVEIAKSLTKDLRLLIMDEPTSSLTDGETRKLFEVIADLKKQGITIIYISHRMEEIFEICDSYTIMRDGTFIISGATKDTDMDTMIRHMVGREMSQVFPKHEFCVGDVILKGEHISNGKEVKDVSFELRKGEILGFSGLVGAGRTETFKALFGYDKDKKGSVYVNGKEVTIRSPKDAIKYGIGYVPEDRRNEGLVTELPVVDNTIMAKMEKAMTHGLYNAKKAGEICKYYIDSLYIKTPSQKKKARLLSGGNQQKVVLSKWLNCDSDILILDEPTRGIDVNAKREIYQMIVDLVEAGKSVVLISSELPEIIGLCNRVYVMYEGEITGMLQQDELTQEKIMYYAAGGR
ncbi:MAG: sugar ABC transporter ATP-binding protein [Eubacteriales bacterium]|nr:sugar ABC transporter ATP-binding protein [Eubacteriales bacterium]